jgi:hypothetical protein
MGNTTTYIQIYHSRFIPKGIAEASQIFSTNTTTRYTTRNTLVAFYYIHRKNGSGLLFNLDTHGIHWQFFQDITFQINHIIHRKRIRFWCFYLLLVPLKFLTEIYRNTIWLRWENSSTIDRPYQDTSVVPGDNEGTAGVSLAGASAAGPAGADVTGLNEQWEGTRAFAVGDDREVDVIECSRDAATCNKIYCL